MSLSILRQIGKGHREKHNFIRSDNVIAHFVTFDEYIHFCMPLVTKLTFYDSVYRYIDMVG